MKKKDGAHVVFYRTLRLKNGRKVAAILLTKRTLDAPSDPGDWGLVGGTMERGETPKKAALREVNEELCYRTRPLIIRELCKVKKENTVHFFQASLEEDMDTLKLKRNPKGKVEGEGIGWFTLSEVGCLRVRPQDLSAISRYFS
jgi:8-oxo-dGTP pyrophosphatase MutT (NUDIX family)